MVHQLRHRYRKSVINTVVGDNKLAQIRSWTVRSLIGFHLRRLSAYRMLQLCVSVWIFQIPQIQLHQQPRLIVKSQLHRPVHTEFVSQKQILFLFIPVFGRPVGRNHIILQRILKHNLPRKVHIDRFPFFRFRVHMKPGDITLADREFRRLRIHKVHRHRTVLHGKRLILQIRLGAHGRLIVPLITPSIPDKFLIRERKLIGHSPYRKLKAAQFIRKRNVIDRNSLSRQIFLHGIFRIFIFRTLTDRCNRNFLLPVFAAGEHPKNANRRQYRKTLSISFHRLPSQSSHPFLISSFSGQPPTDNFL